eukprot:507048_1
MISRQLINSSIQTAIRRGNLCASDSIMSHVSDSESGIRFAFRVANNLANKPTKSDSKRKNPFLPPFEDGLHVCDLPPTHRLILNKYPLTDAHCLITSRDFRHQTDGLKAIDFEKTLSCVRAIDGMGCYNCGPESGFSQTHLHMQNTEDRPLTQGEILGDGDGAKMDE